MAKALETFSPLRERSDFTCSLKVAPLRQWENWAGGQFRVSSIRSAAVLLGAVYLSVHSCIRLFW